MPEIEIKLQIPSDRLAGVRTALLRGRCETTRMQAVYVDTPDQLLRRAAWVLRLRREGRRWVQAVKGRGDDLTTRPEHEVALGSAAATPTVDVRRHAESPAFAPLQALLADVPPDALQAQFRTDFRRTARAVRYAGAVIDVALDEGWIVAGEARAPIAEIEFELKSGPMTALIDLATRWADRHQLWLDVRSKSERGYLLAAAEGARPAVHAITPNLARDADAAAVLRAGVQAALQQVLPNGAALAAGVGGAEHLHQARIGVRRLRSLLREFDTTPPSVHPERARDLVSLFRALGTARDADVLKASVLPRLKAVGAPPLHIPPPLLIADPGAAFRAAATTHTLLALIGFAAAAPVTTPATVTAGAPTTDARDPLRARLAQMHKRVQRAGKAFDTLDDGARHNARKVLKRLRYCAEALSSRFPRRAWKAYVKQLRQAQDALGDWQDLTLAQAVFESLRTEQPQAWFALGWLAERRPAAAAQARDALRALGKAPKFLRP